MLFFERKARFVVLIFLSFSLILAACTETPAALPNAQAPTPPTSLEDAIAVARSFLDSWLKNDYAAMYGLLSPRSLLISREVFTETYQQVEQVLKLTEKDGKSYKLAPEDAQRQGDTAIIRYDMTFSSTAAGRFSDPKRTMRLVLTPRGWRIAWSAMDIFEGMAGGAALQLDPDLPRRGTIYDRNGKVIAADATPNRAVRLLTRAYPARPEDCISKLADVFRQKYSDLAQYLNFTGKDFGFTVGTLSEEEFERLQPQLDSVCRLEYRKQTTRYYYGGGIAAQTVGFIAPIQPDQLGNYPQLPQGALIGQYGIEKYWQDKLAGGAGARLVIRTSDGVTVRTIQTRPSSPSQDVTLTLDRDVQLMVESALSNAYNAASWAPFSPGAAAIVLDVNTGEVLALASYPTVNPDAFLLTTSFDTPQTQQLYERRRATSNRATQETFALGSVFKIVSMAAAAETKAFQLSQVVTCLGTYDGRTKGDQLRKDWIYLDPYAKPNYHGPLTLKQALTASCDVYFWEVGEKLNFTDATLLRKFGNQMGLGRKTGIDAILEEAGRIPDPDSTLATTGRRWGLGDSLNIVIGQGDVQVTPLQVARMMMGVANGGKLYQPYLVRSVGQPGQQQSYAAQPPAPEDMGISPAVLQGIEQALCDVTRDDKIGTAQWVFEGFDMKQISVCGKTGTAQNATPYPNGWFAAYAGKPGQPPDIAVVVFVQRSREGSETAAPIVRRIIESYYNLPISAWPRFWSDPYELMPDPNVSDGGGPRRNR